MRGMKARSPLTLEYAPTPAPSPFERMPKWLQNSVLLVVLAGNVAIIALGAFLVIWLVGWIIRMARS